MSQRWCLNCRKQIEPGSSERYGLHECCFISWFNLEKAEEFTVIERRAESGPPRLSEKGQGWNTSFFHGKFKKYSAQLAGESYIFKMKQDEAPELPDVEYLSNQIAKLTGVPVPAFYLIEFHGERTFVTKNFVKRSTNITLNHIYQHLSNTDKYDCETLVTLILNQTNRRYDVDIFVRACLFDSLIGNHDRHGRNLGLIVTPKGTSLAPIYDNPSALGLEQGEILQAEFEPMGKIMAHKEPEPTAKDYVKEFSRLGYEDSIQTFLERVNIAKIETLVQESTCSQQMKTALIKLILRRYQEMKNATEQRSRST